MRLLLLLMTFFLCFTISLGQKIKSDGYEISFKSIEIKEIEISKIKHEIYSGIIKVKAKNGQQGNYYFFLPIKDGNFSYLTIRNSHQQILKPRLYYNEDKKTFSYYRGTDKAKSEEITSNESVQNIILYGSLIWLKIQVDK